MPVTRVQSILFESVTACNLDCVYCYNCWKAVPDYPRGRLSTRQTIRMLKKAAVESGARQVAITGGEPLLRDDLPDLAAALRLAGVGVSVLSNGVLMTREWAQDLVRTGVGLVQLTLLAMDEKLHDEHCGPGAFAAIFRALDHLRAVKMRVAITLVVTKRTVEEVPKVMRVIKKIGQKSFLLNRFNPGGRAIRDHLVAELMLTKEETARMLKLANDAGKALSVTPVAAVPIPPCVVDRKKYPLVKFAGCAAATNDAYFTLDPLGNVRMCNHSPVILGNILRQGFYEIAQDRRCREWIEVRPEFCKPCPGWDRCKGGCRAVAQQMGLALDTLDPYVAEAVKDWKPGR